MLYLEGINCNGTLGVVILIGGEVLFLKGINAKSLYKLFQRLNPKNASITPGLFQTMMINLHIT